MLFLIRFKVLILVVLNFVNMSNFMFFKVRCILVEIVFIELMFKFVLEVNGYC